MRKPPANESSSICTPKLVQEHSPSAVTLDRWIPFAEKFKRSFRNPFGVVGELAVRSRRYRCAQPPAIVWHPFGIRSPKAMPRLSRTTANRLFDGGGGQRTKCQVKSGLVPTREFCFIARRLARTRLR